MDGKQNGKNIYEWTILSHTHTHSEKNKIFFFFSEIDWWMDELDGEKKNDNDARWCKKSGRERGGWKLCV